MPENTLKTQIQEAMKDAMRAKEAERLGTIRMLLAAIKQREIDEQITLTDADTSALINKMIKQRRESAKQYQDANRPELADKEEREIKYLECFLPEQLDQAAIEKLVQEAVQSTGASSMKDMGAVMAILRPKVLGRADMSAVSAVVKLKIG